MQSEAARLKSRIGELEASNTILNDQYHAILTQLTSQQQEYERKIDRNEHEIHRYEERIEENENRLNEILKINHTSEREILNLQDKLYKKDRLIKELENKLQEMKYQQESSHQEYERNSKKYEEEIENEKEKYLKLENQSKLEINELKKEVERKIPELIQQIHCELESSYYEKLQSELHEKEMKYQHSREELLQEYLNKEEKYQNKLNNLQKERYEEKLQYEKYYERCHNYEEKITEMSNIIHEYKEKERYYSYFQQKHLHHPPPPPPPTHGPPPSRGGEPSYRGGIRPSSYDINGNKRIGDGKTMMKSDELTQATYPIPHHHHMNTLTSTANTSTSNIIEEEPYDEGTYYDPSSYSHAHGHHVPIEDGNTSMETKAILSLNQQIAEMRQTLQDNLQQTKEKNKQILQAQQQSQQPQQYSNLTKKSSPSVPPPFPLPQPSLSDTQREKSISFLSPPRTHPSSSSQKNSNNHGVYSPEQLFQSPKHIKYPKHETSSTSTSQYPAESTINQSVFSNHSHEGLYPDYTSSYRNREGMGGVGGGGGGNIQSRNQFHGILPPTSSDSSDYSTATASSRSSHQDITLPTGGYHEGYWKAKYAKLHVR